MWFFVAIIRSEQKVHCVLPFDVEFGKAIRPSLKAKKLTFYQLYILIIFINAAVWSQLTQSSLSQFTQLRCAAALGCVTCAINTAHLWRFLGGMILQWLSLPRGAKVYLVAKWHVSYCLMTILLAIGFLNWVIIFAFSPSGNKYCDADRTDYGCEMRTIFNGLDHCDTGLLVAQVLLFSLMLLWNLMMLIVIWWITSTWACEWMCDKGPPPHRKSGSLNNVHMAPNSPNSPGMGLGDDGRI